MRKISGVYKIVNNQNNKIYIGSSIDIHKRKLQHYCDLRGNRHHSIHLQRAFNLFGEDSLVFNIIELVADESILIEREQYWMDYYSSYQIDKGYNISKTAGRVTGIVVSEETRKKISNIHRGVKKSLEHRRKISESQKGKTIPEYQKELLRKLKTGKKQNPDHIKKAKEARKAKNIKLSEVHKKIISEKNQGEGNSQSKLTEREVKEIKLILKDKKFTQIKIAEMYNVSQTTIWKINKGIKWSHISI